MNKSQVTSHKSQGNSKATQFKSHKLKVIRHWAFGIIDLSKILLFSVMVLFSKISFSQSTPGIISDWMDFAGISDTLTVIPVVKDDSSNIISVGANVDSISGPDILVTKLDSGGSVEWQRTFSSPGNNRDQGVAVTVDDKCSIYVTGVIYSSATNYDWVVLKYGYDGTLEWTYTLNGTFNNYDVPAAIKTKSSFVYVTGEVYDSVSQLNYATVQLNRTTGALNWKRQYNFNNLFDISFAMDIAVNGRVTVAGASQDSITKWNYCSVTYDSMGVAVDTTRTQGTNNSFDRPMAVKCDVHGNFYITGAGTDSAWSFNVRTVKVDSSGNISWMVDYGSMGYSDEGNDLLIDDSGYVYVCGKTYAGAFDKENYLLVKYNNAGTEQWHRTLDTDDKVDVANRMCFDNYGNIVLTGKAGNRDSDDFRTVAYSKNGDLLWSIYFDGEFEGNDEATGITSDEHGNIFVSGLSQITDSTWEKVTIKYKTDYFLVPQDTIPAPSNLLFYPNWGQIIDTNDSLRGDVSYYSINQYPKLYFHTDSVSFVMAKIDKDTTVADTLERISMNFKYGNMSDAYCSDADVHYTDQILNYYLGHCPDGITEVTGTQRIIYGGVYENTDVIYSNNHSGMKFQIMMNPGAEPQAVLHFTGHQSLHLISNSDLQVNGSLGSITYERPLAYQLDIEGNRISLGWLASYYINGNDVSFVLGGSYDPEKTLVLECARAQSGGAVQDSGLCWSTYFGAAGSEYGFSIAHDNNNSIVIAGETQSPGFPVLPGAAQFNFIGLELCYVSKFNSNDSLIYSTFWGGSNGENIAQDVKCNSSNDIYIGGFTTCTNFPNFHPTGSWRTSINAGANGFLVQFNSIGQIVWSTYFGGRVFSIDFDSNDNFYVSGYANPSFFPLDSVSGKYFQQNAGSKDAFLTKFNSNDTIVWSTYFGGNGDDWAYTVRLDANANVFLHGGTKSSNFPYTNPGGLAFIDSTLGGSADDFIVKFDSVGVRKWATLIGGSAEEGLTFLPQPAPANRIAFDSGRNIYIVGTTNSNNFPLKTSTGFNDSTYADRDGYVMKFNASNYSTQWSSYISGQGGMELESVEVASNDRLIIGGGTEDSSLYLHQQTNLYYQDILKNDNHPSRSEDACILAFDSQHNLIYGTYYGGYTGSGGEIIQDMTLIGEKLFMTGMSTAVSGDFPLYNPGSGAYYDSTQNGFFDVFVSELCIDQLIGVDEIVKPEFPLELFPNPVFDEITISFELEKSEKIGISIYNSIGQCVLFEDYKATAGRNRVILRPTELSQGFYFVSVTTLQGGTCKKFIKFDR